MRADPALIKSYGTALFEAAKNKGVLDVVATQAEQLKAVIEHEDRLVTFLEAPNIARDVKDQLFTKVFGGRYHSMLIHFVQMLIRRGRLELFRGSMDMLHQLYLEHQGYAEAELVTAVELGEADKARLQQALNSFTGRKLRLNYKVDATVIGGVRFLCGDLLIDNTLSSALARLQQDMLSTRMY